ncbi:MAG TPA: hypothetical protein PK006_04375 [Saprospiraceae bacterium]|nr:hypothetical protein [Saprospiraceae bacterium]
MFQEYFKLQYKRIYRSLRDWGFSPLLSLFLIPIIGILFVFYIQYKTEYPGPVLIVLGTVLINGVNQKQKLDFLRNSLGDKLLGKIRLIEGLLIVIPLGLICLLWLKDGISAMILLCIGVLQSLVRVDFFPKISFPSLYALWPFEFTVGFRKTWFILLFGLSLVFIAHQSENVNLVFLSILLGSICFISFYAEPEHEYYVWIFNTTINRFLLIKIWTAFVCSSLYYLVILGLSFLCFNKIEFPVLILIAFSYLILFEMILSKYANFPHPISIPDSILLIISIIVPPFVIFTIPFFYKKSVRHLKSWLQ